MQLLFFYDINLRANEIILKELRRSEYKNIAYLRVPSCQLN